MKKTKIVCTLGPACRNEETLTKMALAGMNVARLNFSHGDYEEHAKNIELIKKVREKLNIPLPIMLDTKGPELRIKTFKNKKITLKEGDEFTFTTEDVQGDQSRVSVSYKGIVDDLEPGDTILLNNGLLIFRVTEVNKTEVKTRVEVGGDLSDKKSMFFPGKTLSLKYLSEQDKNDILFGIQQNVDYIAASFTRNKEDVISLRKFLDYHGGHDIKIISKIENIEGVENFNEILRESDGIMVARGDMGVEIEFERLPGLQKRFIRRCNQAGKIVITATQMLDSMMTSASPTRAEITDVANAVFDGTSAVMLSGETAAGKYPVEAVQVMAKIATQAEKDAFDMLANRKIRFDLEPADKTNAVCDAACTMAMDVHAKAIIVVTKYGHTARRMSKFRPFMPVVAATHVERTYHQMSMNWGVFPVLAQPQKNSDDLMRHAIDCAKQIDMVTNGDLVVIAAGVPVDTPGSTNLLKVEVVGERR